MMEAMQSAFRVVGKFWASCNAGQVAMVSLVLCTEASGGDFPFHGLKNVLKGEDQIAV